jgi:hypothetical protein
MSRKIKITGAVILILLTAAIIAFFSLTTKAERKFGVSIPKTPSREVMSTAFVTRNDLIINIPEDYIRELSESRPTYDEVVEELGEPNVTTGFGICRACWRIGERKYAEYVFMGDAPFFEIREY